MPFQSQAQRRFLFAKHPKIAEKFAEHTEDMKELPEYAHGNKSSSKETKKFAKPKHKKEKE